MIATVALGQTSPAVAVFNNLSPTVKGITIGASHCYIWAHLGTPWDTEAACYTGGILKQIQVAPAGVRMQGSYPMDDGGIFSWLVKGTQFSMSAQPFGGVELQRSWTE